MDENLRTKLITLYATRDVAEIEDSSEHLKKLFGSDREALLGNNELIELKQTIKEQKESLELCEQRYKKKHAKPLGDSKEQVIECLKLLLNKATFTTAAETLYQRQMDILYRLVIERYCKRVPWPPDLREHFDFLYPKIRDWNLFFLSYTNEGAGVLNRDYRVTIKNLILTNNLDMQLSAKAWRDHNLVAELIFQHLRRNNILKGFYDKNFIRIGNELDEAVGTACKSSFLFIQLVTKDALAFHERNWPFKEYQLFKNYNDEMLTTHGRYQNVLEQRFLFALGGGQLSEVTPAGLQPFDYHDWYDHIGRVHHKSPPNDVQLFSQSIGDIAARVAAFVERDWIQAI